MEYDGKELSDHQSAVGCYDLSCQGERFIGWQKAVVLR